jgi:hypothetical protein
MSDYETILVEQRARSPWSRSTGPRRSTLSIRRCWELIQAFAAYDSDDTSAAWC